MIALIVSGAVLAYMGLWTWCGRLWYQRWRPAREPIYCEHWLSCRDGHHAKSCYRRDGSAYEGEARFSALMAGLVWPLTLPAWALVAGITWRTPLTLAEREARIKRMERELGIREP